MMRRFALVFALFLGCGARGPERPLATPAVETDGFARVDRVAFGPNDELAPSASSDGRYVAFVSDETGNLEVWIKDLAGDSPYPLTQDASDDTDPSFAPKSARILFVSRRADAKGDVFWMDADGGGLKKLTDEQTADRQPVFSPDEKQIYFTSSSPVGLEFVSVMDAGELEPRRLSPTPGFDPAPCPDGPYLVYTAPGGTSGRRYPHLVALRLTDSATRAITSGESPAGFARFGATKGSLRELVYVRFADDDNEDGVTDGSDRASIWSSQIDLDGLFTGALSSAVSAPYPLTAGSRDELFPSPVGPWVYFTETAQFDQDMVRLPIQGMFPRYENLEDYFRLAESSLDPRERWFSYRALAARTEPSALFHARALLAIAKEHLEAKRLDLAQPVLNDLDAATADAEPKSDRAELGGLAKVELIALERTRGLAESSTPLLREQVLRATRSALEGLRDRYVWSPSVAARVDLELAEVVVERGDRVAAIAAFDRVVQRHRGVPYSAARAMLRRTELLEVAFDPDALGEAYAAVLRAFPSERWLVTEAAEKIVEAQLRAEPGTGRAARRAQASALRRVLLRSESPPVRFAARQRLVAIYTKEKKLDRAARELEQLVAETSTAGDRLLASRSLADLARVDEERGALEEALEHWSVLRRDFGDLPGVGATVRDAITRVALRKAVEEEARGNLEAARASYRAVLENDPTQVRAHRRYLAISARSGRFEEALAEAKERRDRSPRTPIFRYAYALALTWTSPPSLSEAQSELDAALNLNPQFALGYLTRGWINEMRELDSPDEGFLEKAIEDYTTAARLNPETTDRATEAEISLNLGNAKWRLADRTNDAGNFAFAFRDYVEAMAFGLTFDTPERELVFWERFGRAAAWVQEWAASVMATREALRLIDRLTESNPNLAARLASRRAQLWGNMALAYGQAGEDVYAEEAFKQFEAALAVDKRESRLIVAKRNLAVAKLRAARAAGGGDLRGALEELSEARQKLLDVGETPIGSLPMLAMTVPDATRAPFGFESLVELDLNLSLAAEAHRERGDVSRARAIDQEREKLVLEILDGHKPITLNIFRERIGLSLREARAACRAAELPACTERFAAVLSELEGAIGNQDLEKDRPFLHVERGLVLALAAEEQALHEAGGGTAALVANLDGELASSLEDVRRAPLVGSATVAASSTTSVENVALAAFAAEARMQHAMGLLQLARAPRRAEPAASDLKSVIGALDSALESVSAAGTLFSRASEAASKVAGSFAALIAVAARHGLEATTFSDSSAASEAEKVGAFDWAFRFRLARALGGSLESALEVYKTILPALIDVNDPALDRFASRSASVALSRGDVASAFDLIDRRMMLRAAGGPIGAVRAGEAVEDRNFAAEMKAALADLEDARDQLAARPEAGASELAARRASLEKRISEVQKKLAALAEKRISPALEARIYGRAFGAESLADELAADQALLLPASIEGELVVFFADGSTLAAERLIARRTGVKFSMYAADLESGAVDKLRASLLAPLENLLAHKRTLVVAGDPVPLEVFGNRFGVAFVSAPSVLPASKSASPLGAQTKVRIASGAEATIGDALALAAEEALQLEHPPEPLSDEAPRSLEARPKAEQLASHAQVMIVVEPEVLLEPAAPERSVIDLGARAEIDSARRFAREVPLASLSMPAQVLILARAAERSAGGTAIDFKRVLPLDLALAPAGVGSIVVIPSSVPPAVARTVITRIADASPKIGLARAVSAAVHEASKSTPFASGIVLLGAPGFEAAGEQAAAKTRLGALVRNVAKLAKEGRFAEVIAPLQEVLRLQRAAKDTSGAPGAYQLLVVALQRTQQFARAADAQRELVAFLEKSATNEKAKNALVLAGLELGSLYAKARDFDAANVSLRAAVRELEAQKDVAALAVAWRKIAEVEKERLNFAAAAQAYERSIAQFEALGMYGKKEPSADAIDVLRQAGNLLLNRLSDTLRARLMYQRVLAVAPTKELKAATEIDLARVARRRGEFEAAAERAEKARAQAVEAKRSDIELDAVIEGANVAWYRGDYARGLSLCKQSLQLAASNLKASKQDKLRNTGPHVQRLIFAGSVCGLLEMSTGNFDAAERHLLSGVRLAKSIDNRPEEAAQYNNLGRVYLEFGKLDRAIAAFSRARAIDQSLNDRFGLAYDLRNLGTAQVVVRQDAEAVRTLGQALDLSRAVQDSNNELRALFALAELARRRDERDLAKSVYTEALPLAEKLENKDLAWQIQRSLGLLAFAAGDFSQAEERLLRAIAVARTMRGSAAPSELSPHRYAPFDDLTLLYLQQGRQDEAFATAELARILAQTERMDDRRVKLGADVPALITRVRAARTSSDAASALEALRAAAPRIASRLVPSDPRAVSALVPADAAVIVYRATDDALLAFVLDGDGLFVQRVDVRAPALGELIERYRQGLHEGSDVSAAGAALSALLIEPILPRISGKKRLGLVLQGGLRYVAFPALPVGSSGELLIDRFLLVQALDPSNAAQVLSKPSPSLSSSSIVAMSGASGGALAPLDFAAKELQVILEEHPRAEVLKGDRASKTALSSALSRSGAVVHFAGHASVTGPDPLAGELRTTGEPLYLYDVLSSALGASLVVLSACETRAGTPRAGLDVLGAGEEVLSLAESFRIAGAGQVLSTTMRVNDVASALLMKRFYRAARGRPIAEALREAQLTVRKYEPHPAWWATFSLLGGE